MRGFLTRLIFLTALLTAACGTVRPATAPKDIYATASPVEPQPASVSSGISAPLETTYRRNIRFEQFGLEDGLSQSVVNVIIQDRVGFLWIGTQDGLNRYDGYNFKIYKPDPDNPNSLSDRWITALAEDPHGYLWVGTRLGGLNRYDPVSGKFKRYMNNLTDSQSLGSNQVTSLQADTRGIWVGTEYGLDFFNYETETFTHHRSSSEDPSSLSSNLVSALFKDSQGMLWVGTLNGGVNMYDETAKTFTIYKYEEDNSASLSNNRVSSIAESSDGSLWVGTSNGLNRFEAEEKAFTHFHNIPQNTDSLGGNVIFEIYKDRSGGLWIGTNNGLDRYDDIERKFYHYQNQPGVPNTISNNAVLSIFEDNSNVLWIGTHGGGLNKYNRQQDKFTYYRNNPADPNSLSGNIILPIYVDQKGIIWIGTNRGLDKFEPATGQFTHYQHDPANNRSLISDDVVALQMDYTGILWVGTMRGLDRFNPATGIFTHFQPDANIPNNITNSPIYSIYEDSSLNLWIGTGIGLYLFNEFDRSFTPYESDESDPVSFFGDQINIIYEDNDKNLWVGTFESGLKRLNPRKTEVTQYKNDPENMTSLGNDSVMSIIQDENDTIWVGTAGGGLNRYEPETDSFTRFTEKDGLPNDVIYGILEDSSGNLWISTNFGLSRFDPRTETFRNYTASDGLQSNEFNQNAYAVDMSGNLYFGGVNGLNSFNPENIKDNPLHPHVALTSITKDGIPLNSSGTTEYLKEITLTWPEDSFEFEFTSFAYGQPSKNQYAYMLERFDSDWKNIDKQRNGRYTNLPGGTYTLKLRGSNSDGTWNEEGQSITVTIVPPFWETWLFRSMSFFVLVTVIAAGLRWRVKSIQRRNYELENIVQKRTADLQKRTGEIEALYQADERILRNVTLNQVFQTLVDVSVSVLKADRSVVFTWSEEQQKILPRVSHSFRPETLNALTFDEGEGMIGQAMNTGNPVIVSDLNLKTLRADIQTVIGREGIQSFAHFPIVVDGRVVAVFNVAYTRPNALNEDAIRLFTSLVNRAALSIANMELFEQTKDLAVMEERNRLARDLHDSAKQKAFAALAQLGTANGIFKARPEEANIHIAEAETLVYDVIQELTFLIQEIYPFALQEKGLPTTLREYIFEWENRNDAVVNLTIQNERTLPLETEQAVYRVIQESLANISRHSKAKRVEISLAYSTDLLQITIADDGCGFDMEQKAKGMGFRSMRERIASVRGTLQVQSAPRQGTRLIAQLPIKNQLEVVKA